MVQSITDKALTGEIAVDFPILDMHCHMGPLYSYYFSQAEIEQMLEDADRVGIEKLCLSPHVGLSLDHTWANRQTLDAITKFPDRSLGNIMFNPHRPDQVLCEYERYYAMEQFVGIKVHPAYHRYPLDGVNYITIFEELARRGGYALVHTWEPDGMNNAAQCETILKRFPDTAFVFAHALGVRSGVRKAMDLVSRYDNAYIDTSGFEYSDMAIETIVAGIPEHKLLFGSDCPFHDIRGGLSRVLLADLTDEVKRRILRDNYLHLLNKSPKK